MASAPVRTNQPWPMSTRKVSTSPSTRSSTHSPPKFGRPPDDEEEACRVLSRGCFVLGLDESSCKQQRLQSASNKKPSSSFCSSCCRVLSRSASGNAPELANGSWASLLSPSPRLDVAPDLSLSEGSSFLENMPAKRVKNVMTNSESARSTLGRTSSMSEGDVNLRRSGLKHCSCELENYEPKRLHRWLQVLEHVLVALQ
mmetsp:Transcript_120206/g.385155  ORF Transcript_120206/g.385155 Transcript_120206/m.385155 type:complete len:200 (-) Transcript_120206:11-610(-)